MRRPATIRDIAAVYRHVRAVQGERWARLPGSQVHWFKKRYGLERINQLGGVEELIGEANLAYARALKKFDPFRGFQFSTYATISIRRRLLSIMDRYIRRIAPVAGRCCSLDEAMEVCERSWMGETSSFRDDLADLRTMVARLPAMERRVLRLRWVDGLSVKQAAKRLDMESRRVRSFERRAMVNMLRLARGATVREREEVVWGGSLLVG